MKRIYRNTTILLTLLVPSALVQAQFNHFQNNSANPNNRTNNAAPSRPTPNVTRPEPRVTRPEPSVSRSEPTRSEPRESRPAPRENRPAIEETRPAPRVNTPEAPVNRPTFNATRPTPRENEPTPSLPNRTIHTNNPAPATHSFSPAPQAEKTIPMHNGGRVNVDAGGRVTSFHDQARGITVSHGPRNVRVVESKRPDGTRLVAVGRGHGFVERPLAARPGFVARTYVTGGRSYVRVYRENSFHGFVYHRFVPGFYYHPRFYAWAFNPWPAPIYFSWGWNAPWYGYYGAYFTPAPVYATPALWLTDYLLAENLKLAYENQQQTGDLPPAAPGSQTVALSPEVKQLIAEEVKQQIAAEQGAVQSDTTEDALQNTSTEAAPPALDPTQRVFVVSAALELQTLNGQVCSLTPGDIILRSADTIGADGKVGISILASKPGDCAINTANAIDIDALQEMHNQFREQVDAGLGVLANNQGKGGLPKGPAPAPRPVTVGWAQADATAQSTLMQEQQDADQAEVEAQQAANGGPQN